MFVDCNDTPYGGLIHSGPSVITCQGCERHDAISLIPGHGAPLSQHHYIEVDLMLFNCNGLLSVEYSFNEIHVDLSMGEYRDVIDGEELYSKRMMGLLINLGFLFLFLSKFMTSMGAPPGMFIFGDSLSDSGNNNFIPTLAKSNYPPYGIDFPQGPTGRFSNGKLAVDMIAEMLGLPFAPPFTDPSMSDPQIFQGVNYASAAAGILDETGKEYMGPIPLSKQIDNFRQTLPRIYSLFGQNASAMTSYLNKVLVMVSIGSNDYLNNYLRPDLYPTSSQYTPLAFSNLLVQQIAQQLVGLYNMGIRRFMVYALGPLGCTPNQLTGQNCNDRVNQMVMLFNSALRSLIIDLNLHLPASALSYADAYGMVSDILINPSPYGFSVTSQGCCGVENGRVQWSCIAGAAPCNNRNSYVFWDSLHPTEALNRIVAQRSFMGPQSDVYPFNIQQLVSI